LHLCVRRAAKTDRDVAEQDIAGAAAGRFQWIDFSRISAGKSNEVLRALFAAH
jgi:hypothetical protein